MGKDNSRAHSDSEYPKDLICEKCGVELKGCYHCGEAFEDGEEIVCCIHRPVRHHHMDCVDHANCVTEEYTKAVKRISLSGGLSSVKKEVKDMSPIETAMLAVLALLLYLNMDKITMLIERFKTKLESFNQKETKVTEKKAKG